MVSACYPRGRGIVRFVDRVMPPVFGFLAGYIALMAGCLTNAADTIIQLQYLGFRAKPGTVVFCRFALAPAAAFASGFLHLQRLFFMQRQLFFLVALRARAGAG